MNERDKGLFPLILGLAVLGICGGFFGLFMWLSQPSIPSSQTVADEAASEYLSGALETVKPLIPKGAYRYGGSATMVPIRQVVEPLIDGAVPTFKLDYTSPAVGAPNSTRGIEMLLAGELAFADSSRPLRPEEYKAAEVSGFELQQTPFAIDGIAVTVHPDLDIEGLTMAQLRDIFLGYVTNWYEVGGPDLAIRPYSMSPSNSGTASFFVRRVLKGDALGDRVEIVNETTPVLRQIAAEPGGIYYVSAPLAVPQCSVKTLPIATKAERPYVAPYQEPRVRPDECPIVRNQINKDAFKNGTYPLMRRLFVVSKQGEGEDAIAGTAYSEILLSAEGQALVEEVGFVSTR